MRAVVLFLLSLLITGCPGSLDDIDRFREAGSCGDIPTTVFAKSCTFGGCHSAADKAGDLDLASPDVHGRLSGKPASGGGVLIDPMSPEKSVLYTKLTTTPPFGSRMPQARPPLDDATLACVRAFVNPP